MRILVTRPDPDGARLVDRLSAAGHEVLYAPLLNIVFKDGLRIDPDAYQALLLTSANGVRALAAMTEDRKARLFCVGDATARTAKALGFSDLDIAGGDVHALTDLVRDRLVPSDKPLLHVAGSVVAGDLQGMLAEAGFRVERIVAYHAEPVAHLPQEVLATIREQAVDLALFYSPRTARIFVSLIEAAEREKPGLSRSLSTVTAGCLSEAVRDALQSLRWHRIVTSEVPSEAALLAASGLEPNTTPN